MKNEDVKSSRPLPCILKNEDYNVPYLLKMKFLFLKLLKTEDLNINFENVKKMKTTSCVGSPSTQKYFGVLGLL